jgi:hypothetical protein
MSCKLVVWKWTPSYDSSAKRRKLGVKYEDITAAFGRDHEHAAMAAHDFAAFEKDVLAEVGPLGIDRPKRHPCALVFEVPSRQVPALVMKIGMLARKHGLTSAEL